MKLALLFFLSLLTIVGAKTIKVAHIAPAFDVSLNDGWARFILYQEPNGTILIYNRINKTTTEIQQPYTPKKKSPLSAYSVGVENDDNQISLSFLDTNGYMVDVSCHQRNDDYYDWSSRLSQKKSASGLAIVQSGTQTRRLFIDGDGYIAQELNSITVRVGPKAAKGSQLATAVAAQSDIIHLFYIALDKSLSSITFNGTAWDTTLPAIPNFNDDATINFAAAAWANPAIIRVFYANDKSTLKDYTLTGPYDGTDSWTSVGHDLGEGTLISAGEPVAASRAENGTGRYLEYFYNAKDGNDDTVGKINYLARNDPDDALFTISLITISIDIFKLTVSDKIAIGSTIGGTAVAVLVDFLKWQFIKRAYIGLKNKLKAWRGNPMSNTMTTIATRAAYAPVGSSTSIPLQGRGR